MRRKPIIDRTFLDTRVADAGVTVDPSLAFEHLALRQATEYWRSKCGSAIMPSREDLRTSDMRKFVAHVALVTVDEPENPEASGYTIRLAGSEVEKVFGPISGKSLADALPGATAIRWGLGYKLVRTTRRPVRFCGQVLFEDKRWLTAETLMAPLGDAVVRMIFCAFAAWHDLAQKS